MGKGGGGGGGSGSVDYPSYMKDVHGSWINHTGTDAVTTSMTDLLNAGFSASPFAFAEPYDPSVVIGEYIDLYNTTKSYIDSVAFTIEELLQSATSSYDTTVVPATYIDDVVTAHSAKLDEDLVIELARFNTQSRDVGAVMTSSFVIGQALLTSRKANSVALTDAQLRNRAVELRQQGIIEIAKTHVDAIERYSKLKLAATTLFVEMGRITIVANKEYTDQAVAWEEADVKWAFEMYGYAGNLLATIQGAAVQPGAKQPSQVQSAIGGALSGAAMGASVGGPMGAGIGAAVGLIGGLM